MTTVTETPTERADVAVVTGGSAGIGLAIVERLLGAGHRVAYCGSSADRIAAAEDRLAIRFPEARRLARAVDLRSAEEISDFIDRVAARLGPVSVLVNNAGISPKVDGNRVPFHQMALEQWHDVLAVNLTGAMLCTQAVLPGMMDRHYGRIVMIGSQAARGLPRIAGSAYVASKAALAGLARSLAAEYGAFGITANTVAPGTVATAMTGGAGSPRNREAATRIPAGRVGEPDDIAGIVAVLCARNAGFINGATVDATGGEYVPA